ncbi:flagellar hook-length control protein FliK [Vibrio sp. 404]|uniref:Flagellar hook-length control protein FliK n=1 Tax=Vibrio marinisediminis TaxID=2758441 RepID=A0A7W2FT00_9VIBR|nr:flagellar hook-length control protein FliK [Vibrio marinisediminis]MBA5763713.1 flagellar hook-length control protein FliK [Vibrio marinisediminis]
MNVNLTSATEATKLSKGGSDKATSLDETSEAEGFFAKLTAMLKGESEAELEKTDVVTESNGEESVEEGTVNVDATAEKSTDAVLNASESEVSSELSEEELMVKADKSSDEKVADGQRQNEQLVDEQAVTIPKELEKFIENADKQAFSSSDVEQTVAESEELLGRLEQSSKALQQADGNTLPLQQAEQAPLAASPTEEMAITPQAVALSDSQPVEGDVTQGQTPQAVELIAADTLASEQAVIETEDGKELATTQVQSSPMHANSLQVTPDQASETLATDTDAATVVQSDIKMGELAEESVGELAEEAVQPAAIAWQTSTAATQTVDGEKLTGDELLHKQASKPVTNQQLQASLTAAQTQNANTSQVTPSTNANTSALTPATPMDLSAAAQLQANVAPAVKPDNAMLQASLGAKAAATLGQLTQQNETGNGSEASFAQQLSQAAGQTGVNGQIRAEQTAQPQPAMQLNREMASEQVSERIQMMLSKNLKNIDIRLDPPELGRMQIRMNMNGDNATVHFTVANQQARDIVEQAMPRLREMLAQQGLQLGDTSVQQQASGQQQRQYATSSEGGSGQGSSNQRATGEENLEPDVKLDLNVASKRDGISYYA